MASRRDGLRLPDATRAGAGWGDVPSVDPLNDCPERTWEQSLASVRVKHAVHPELGAWREGREQAIQGVGVLTLLRRPSGHTVGEVALELRPMGHVLGEVPLNIAQVLDRPDRLQHLERCGLASGGLRGGDLGGGDLGGGDLGCEVGGARVLVRVLWGVATGWAFRRVVHARWYQG